MADLSSFQLYAEMAKGLHTTHHLHAGQAKIGQALFDDECKNVFGQLGRNWGKTEFVIYAHWRYAIMNPGSENYYFAPFMKQAREIVWATHRYQGYGPREWIRGINNSEMRIVFSNGSFIKCDGSDNVEAYRGVKPRGLVVYDEFKDFRPEFYDAFDPNRAAHDAPLLITGTPPDRECQYLAVAKEFRLNKAKRWIKGPTHENPHIPRKWLDDKCQELTDRGEFDVWQREYEGHYVPGGISKIFPMLDRTVVYKHEKLIDILKRDRRKLDWYLITDPAAATIFGALFCAINPYTKDVYILDEIYEDDQARMSVDVIGRRMLVMKQDLFHDRWKEWRYIYDEAETWFKNEMHDRFGIFFEPTAKSKNKKEDGLSLIKDVMLQKHLHISERCTHLFKEIDNYYKDKNGKIPKIADHLIDCLRYLLAAAYYSLNNVVEYKEEVDDSFRSAKISDDFPGLDDWGEPKQNEWEELG